MEFEKEREKLLAERKLIIGIDPSFTKMGVCIYNPKIKNPNVALKMNRGDMMEMVKWINSEVKMREIVAVVENPNLDSTTFGMFPILKKEILNFVKGGCKNWGGLQAVFGMVMKRAQDVGKSKASGQLIIKMLIDRGVPVVEIKPSSRDKAYKKEKGKVVRKNNVKLLKMPTKTSQQQFKDLTGFTGSSNEDARDAATMIFGRSVQWVVNCYMFEKMKNKNKPSSYPTTANGNEFLVNGSKNIF